MADDLGYECITGNGGESYQTPNIDKLGRTGIRFEHCYSNPLCAPSRLQLLTGVYNSRNFGSFFKWPPKVQQTLGNVMQENGYTTCVAGKWHFRTGSGEFYKSIGFDRHLVSGVPRYVECPLLEDGKNVKSGKEEYLPDVLNDYACDFLDYSKTTGKPFFLYYPLFLPHGPFLPTPDHRDFDPNLLAKANRAQDTKYFPGMVEYADKLVGKLVARLEDQGLRENTLILFCGDNGTHGKITSLFKGAPYQGGKGQTDRRGMHVPLVANWPAGLGGGGVINSDLIDFTDFLPTLADLAGGKMPKGMQSDGESIAPQLQGRTGTPRESIYCWHYPFPVQSIVRGYYVGQELAQTREYKLYGKGPRDGQFFNLKQDPDEEKPIPGSALTSAERTVRNQLDATISTYTRPDKDLSKLGGAPVSRTSSSTCRRRTGCSAGSWRRDACCSQIGNTSTLQCR